MSHYLVRATILPDVITQIQKEYHVNEDVALGMFYKSEIGKLFSMDESGLYGQSPNFIFSLFKENSTLNS